MYTEIGSYLGLRVNCEDNRLLFLSDGDITEEIKAKLLNIIKMILTSVHIMKVKIVILLSANTNANAWCLCYYHHK